MEWNGEIAESRVGDLRVAIYFWGGGCRLRGSTRGDEGCGKGEGGGTNGKRNGDSEMKGGKAAGSPGNRTRRGEGRINEERGGGELC